MRLFIATSFPPPITRELNERVAKLKPRLPPASWVRPESQHITFAFLGEREPALIERLAPAVQAALTTVPRFEAQLAGCGFFPNHRRARVGWVGIHPEEPWMSIAAHVRAAVTANGVQLDGAEFRPHLTLMRLRDHWPPASADLYEKTLKDFRSQPFEVDCVTLFSSQLNPGGAVHTALRDFRLA